MWRSRVSKAISGFFGPYRWLSNFWPCKIPFEGVTYPSVEHAYQAAKSLEILERQFIASLPHARDAKAAVRAMRLVRRVDCDEVMRRLLLLKFDGGINVELREKIKATGNAELVEANYWGDTYWGVDSRTGKGENRLGKLLMEVREIV